MLLLGINIIKTCCCRTHCLACRKSLTRALSLIILRIEKASLELVGKDRLLFIDPGEYLKLLKVPSVASPYAS